MIPSRVPRWVRAAAFVALALLWARPALAQDPCQQDDPPPPPECWSVSVTPDGQVTPNRAANTGGHSAVFTIQNLGLGDTYTINCYGSGGVTCTGTSVPDVTFFGVGSANVTAYYSVGAPGTGTLVLEVQGIYAYDAGSYSVPIVAMPGVAVTPDGSTAPTRPANSTGHSQLFTVQNTGSGPNTYSFTCSGTNGVTCGTVPNPVPLNAGISADVSMPYSVGAQGTGGLTLTASGGGVNDQGSYSVPILAYGAKVTPDGDVTPERSQNTSGHAAAFEVGNTGGGVNTYTLTCSGTAGVTCTGLSTSSVELWPGMLTSVTATYSVGSSGTGTLTLTASGTNATDAGSYLVPINSFVPSAVVNGQFSMDSSYLLQETANTYDTQSERITQLVDPRGKITNYLYGGNPQSAFLIQATRVGEGGSADLVTDIAYDADGFVASIEDEGRSSRYFTYDTFGRLRGIKNHGQAPIRAYGYSYSRTSPSWTFNPSSPNAVIDTTFIQQTPTQISVVSTGYLDGLGRPIQTVVRDGGNYHVTATQYDAMGRSWRVWKPYTRTTPGYDASFTTNATTFYNNYHATSTAKPYSETSYTADALNRVKQLTPEYIGASPPGVVVHTYGVDVALKQSRTSVADELGKTTRTYADIFGNVVRSILGAGTPESTVTSFTSNVLGQRTEATDPRGLNTTYTFDTRGLRSSRTSPDAGTVNSKFDKGGNVRFSQDANQAAAGRILFTNYDFANRPLVSGEGTATWAPDPDGAPTALETMNGNWLVVRQYDGKPANVFPWSNFWSQIGPLILNNVAGRLVAVASKSNSAWQVTLFSYDADGDVAKRYTYTQANGGGSVLAAVNTVDTLARDLRDAITWRQLTVGSSTFYHWYEYDNRGLLWKLFASTTSTKPGTPDVTDTYRPSGQPQNYQFQGGPLVPIRYTIRGQTEKIGDPALTTYPFSGRYAYHANGTVSEAEFYSGGSPAAQKRYRYVFGTTSYDALNRLKNADFSSWSGSAWTSTLAYDLAGINYDAAGNITALQRYRDTATLIDNLTYTNATTSNRLNAVTDAVAATAETWDAETGSFIYDANGNLKTAPAPYSITAVSYDPANLPLSITRSGVTSTYRYDDAGQRITKQVNGGDTEVYVRDGATTLGVFTVNGAGTPTSWHFNLLWEGRVIGRQPNTGIRRYYHFDHLGSTRAVVEGATVVESYDFEPWGLLMPGRTLAGPTKEGFTSKERDTETGLDYFGARYFMPALGRWSSVDPLADKAPAWSPYVYTNDNPVVFVDPTGRQTEVYTGVAAQEMFRRLQSWWSHRHDPTPLQRRPECGAGGHILACMQVATKPIPALLVSLEAQVIVGAGVGEGVSFVGGKVVNWAVQRAATKGVLAGGHTVARHVGRTTAQLGERLAAQEGISAASTFFTGAQAELAVSGAVRAAQPAITSWLEGTGGTLVIQSVGGRAVGVVLNRGATEAVTTSAFRVVIERSTESSLGYIVKTAYPILVP